MNPPAVINLLLEVSLFVILSCMADILLAMTVK
jgi:hypothetical protein